VIAAIPVAVPAAAHSIPATLAPSGRRASSRRARAWIATPLPSVSAVIRPANDTDRLFALVTSWGRTTKASEADPKTHGAAGAIASQKLSFRIAAGGQERVPPASGIAVSGTARIATAVNCSDQDVRQVGHDERVRHPLRKQRGHHRPGPEAGAQCEGRAPGTHCLLARELADPGGRGTKHDP